jgi:hypothetical protein
MGFVLDAIRKKSLIDFETAVNADWTSKSVSVDDIEGPFSIQLDYYLGSTVNMNFQLEGSVDGETFVPIVDGETSTQVTVNDNEGTHVWDIGALGVSRVRVSVTLNGPGSIVIKQLLFNARRRH